MIDLALFLQEATNLASFHLSVSPQVVRHSSFASLPLYSFAQYETFYYYKGASVSHLLWKNI